MIMILMFLFFQQSNIERGIKDPGGNPNYVGETIANSIYIRGNASYTKAEELVQQTLQPYDNSTADPKFKNAFYFTPAAAQVTTTVVLPTITTNSAGGYNITCPVDKRTLTPSQNEVDTGAGKTASKAVKSKWQAQHTVCI